MAVTIDSALKRAQVTREGFTALRKRLNPLKAFASNIQSGMLLGTNVVNVPYVPLVTAASTDFVAGDGYVMSDGDISVRPVTVNKRKYQSLSYSSQEQTQQPFLLTDEIWVQKMEKLILDVTLDIMTVITAANYGSAVYTGAASGFNLAALATVRKACIDAQWPLTMGSLVLNSAFDAAFIQDANILPAMNYGGSETVRSGRPPEILDFDYLGGSPVPANGENLSGFVALPSAIMIAMAPIEPTDEVRKQLTSYELLTDEESGITITYRKWGNPDMDQTRGIMELTYGYAKGEADALKRFVTA